MASSRGRRILPRPKVLWSVVGTGVSPASPFPLDAAGTVFLFDSKQHVPFAVSVKTGRRLWTADVDPALPADLPYVAGHVYLHLTGEVLLVGKYEYVAGYDTKTGRRRWSRQGECWLDEARGRYVMLRCPKLNHDGAVRVLDAATGAEVAFVDLDSPAERVANPRDSLAARRDVALSPGALILAWDNGTKMEGRPLRVGAPPWRIELPPDLTVDGRFAVPMELADGVIIWFGGPIIALDESTGRRLWSARFPRDISPPSPATPCG